MRITSASRVLLALVLVATGLGSTSLATSANAAEPERRDDKQRNEARSVSAERDLARDGESTSTAARLSVVSAYLTEAADAPSKLDAARKHLQPVLESEPGNGEALLLAARLEGLSENWRAAAAFYRRAAAARPQDPAVHLGLGDALSRLGDEEGAAEAFARFRAVSGREPIAE